MATFGRYDGSIRSTPGEAVPGVSIAVLTQPADTSSEPGSPLATLYAASETNTPALTDASWLAGVATLELASIPDDLVGGSYLRVAGVNPSGYNGIVQITEVDEDAVTVSYELDADPGAYVSGGTVETSALPNPFESDNLGNFFFYADPGAYTVQVYGQALQEQQVLEDQNAVLGGGAGSVTSVALTMPGEFTVSGSPGSTIVDLGVDWVDVAANFFLAGPSSGPDAAPSFRALTADDFPAGVGTVTSVGLTVEVPDDVLTVVVTNSPIVDSGDIDVAITLVNQEANNVFAGPTSGGADAPAFRLLVADDIPALSAAKITSGLLALARGGTNADLSATGGASQFLKQSSSGAAITVGTIAEADVVNLVADLALKAPLASPSFTGTVSIALAGLQVFANNAAALGGGLVAGNLYRTGSDPDTVCVVH